MVTPTALSSGEPENESRLTKQRAKCYDRGLGRVLRVHRHRMVKSGGVREGFREEEALELNLKHK